MTTARVDLTTDEIIDDNNNSYDAKIPILKRRAASASSGGGNIKDPICVIVVGMAGSGKTTLMSQLQKSLNLRDENDSGRGGDNDEVSFIPCGCCWRNNVLLCVQIYGMCLSFDGFGDGAEPQDGHPSSPCFN